MGKQRQTQTERDRKGQTGTDKDRQGQTGTDRNKKGQTVTDCDRQGQTGTDRDRLGRTGTDRDRKGCPCLSLTKKIKIKQEHSQQRQNRDKTGTRRDNSVEKNMDKQHRD